MGFIHDTENPKFGGFHLETRRESFVIYSPDFGNDRMSPERVEFPYEAIEALEEVLALAKARRDRANSGGLHTV
jgi:hypothetical protein